VGGLEKAYRELDKRLVWLNEAMVETAVLRRLPGNEKKGMRKTLG
jgi:hypothetical protein